MRTYQSNQLCALLDVEKQNFDNFHQHAKVGEVKVYLPCFLPATLGIFATTKCGPYNAISQHFFPPFCQPIDLRRAEAGFAKVCFRVVHDVYVCCVLVCGVVT